MRPASTLPAIAASGVLAYFGTAWVAPGPAGAEEQAAYPEHIRQEQEAQLLERQKKVLKLRQEIEEIHDSEISSKIKKFSELLELLQTEVEIRALLRQDPSLFPLYQAGVGHTAGAMSASDVFPDYTEGDTLSQFCGCLAATRVNWLGQGKQFGEAILTVSGNQLNLNVGDKIGKTLCYLRNTTPDHAMIECHDPIQDEKHTKYVALQTMPR